MNAERTKQAIFAKLDRKGRTLACLISFSFSLLFLILCLLSKKLWNSSRIGTTSWFLRKLGAISYRRTIHVKTETDNYPLTGGRISEQQTAALRYDSVLGKIQRVRRIKWTVGDFSIRACIYALGAINWIDKEDTCFVWRLFLLAK